MADACEFGSLDEANEILGLMMRHWNTIASTLCVLHGFDVASLIADCMISPTI